MCYCCQWSRVGIDVSAGVSILCVDGDADDYDLSVSPDAGITVLNVLWYRVDGASLILDQTGGTDHTTIYEAEFRILVVTDVGSEWFEVETPCSNNLGFWITPDGDPWETPSGDGWGWL